MVIFRKRSEKDQKDIFVKEENFEKELKRSSEEYEDKELNGAEKVSSSIQTPIPAPLFVKLEKYKEIITTLQEIKTLMTGLRNLFTILEEVDQVKNDTINTLRITIQRIEKNIAQLDANFLRTGGEDVEKIKESIKPRSIEVTELEDSLKQLYDELTTMKNEIEKIKGF